MFIFIRVLPVISIAEMRELVQETKGRGNGHAGTPGPTQASTVHH